MKKIVSLFTLITILCITAGCGSKKQIKTQPVNEKKDINTAIQDKKEDYSITA